MSAPFAMVAVTPLKIAVTRAYGPDDLRETWYKRASDHRGSDGTVYDSAASFAQAIHDHEQKRYDDFCELEAAIAALGTLERHLKAS